MSDISNDQEMPMPTFNVSNWDAKLKQAESLRSHFEQQWYTNMAMYRGQQWVMWQRTPATNSGLSLVKPTSSRKRLVFNKIKSISRIELTKLIKEEPQYFVQPNTTDQGDIAAALTSEAISEFILALAEFNKYRRRLTWWLTQTGTGFGKVIYDQNIHLPPVGPNGEEQPNGMVKYEAPSPFHIFVPFLEREDVEDQPWVTHARAYDPDVVKSHFGVSVEPDTQVTGLGYESRFRSAINVRQSQSFKQVHVKETWIKPCAEHPKGRLVVHAGGKTLLDTEFPYDHGEYPIVKAVHIPTGGFYGGSTIDDLVSPQKEYNLTRSQLAEARDMTSKPAMVAVKGSMDIKKLKARPGAVYEVQPGADFPRRYINPDMPTYVTDEMERTIRDMDEISGQYEVTKGRTPPGVEAASAIAYLQEENDTRLYHTVASLEELVSRMGRQSLSLIQQYWDETRIINTVSKTRAQGAISFKGSDLKNNTDLKVVTDSMAPRSRAAKQAAIMELMKLGAVPPEVALKHFGLAETDIMYAELHVDENEANDENLRMARGEEIEPQEWENDVVHIDRHEFYMKTTEFKMLPPDRQQIFIDHRIKHQQIAIATELQAREGIDEHAGNGPERSEHVPGNGDSPAGDELGSEPPTVSA